MLSRGARLVDIQAQQVEVGRIRLGTSQRKMSRQGREYNEPVKLERFRLTSRSETLIRQAAQLYGGEPEPWQPQNGGAQQWEVVIEATNLPVIVPPNACSQFYEQWSGGRCTRRCDGARELIEDVACPCGPDPTDKKRSGCKPTTRLSVMLAQIPGIGVWRLETHGYYAAAELPAVADLLSAAGGNVPARLELEERSAVAPDPRDPNKQVTTRFMVPVLHVEATPAQIIGSFGDRPQLEASPQRAAIEAAPAQNVQDPDAPTPKQIQAYKWYVEKINAAPIGDMDGWAAKVRAEQRLPQVARDQLLALVQSRVNKVAAEVQAAKEEVRRAVNEDPWGEPASTPPDAPITAPWDAVDSMTGTYGGRAVETAQLPPAAPPPAAAPADRDAAWQRINELAGSRGWSMSQVKALYKGFSNGGELSRATAGELGGFFGHLQSQQ